MSYFDHFAAGRSTALGDFLTQKTVAEEFHFLRRHFPCGPETNILEIGPGHGELARLFLQAGFRNYDIAEPNEMMRGKMAASGVRRASSYMIPEIQEKDGSYELIIVCDVFEHLNGATEAQKFISESMRVLRPGGALFILSPDYMDWRGDFFNCDFSHSNPTTVRRVAQMFQNAGFETVAYRYSYACFHGLPGWLLNRIIKLITVWARSERPHFKPYKLRLTFLRRFMVLGQKP
jgi:SAM-dependent methyltransferase